MAERIAACLPGAEAGDVAVALSAGRLPAGAGPLREAVELAAALPGRDAPAFHAATALLLAEALEGESPLAPPDLAAYHDAHSDAYRAAPAAVRAALMNGFRLLHDTGAAPLQPPPTLAERATRARVVVEAGLAGAPLHLRLPLQAALAGGPPGETEALWRDRGRDLVAAPPVADAMRHLYETRDDWDPWRDWPDDRIAQEGVAIPFEAP
ncbi:hypothetical protein DLJ49_05590 [Rhodovulum sp. 12E13]|uniref:hypothetical protein n=1 Tax=Rhodovulum sp. 12E13 TaxID=2203891 RepID=UPI000E13B6CA|nr:hypothetical protein [Rhodovulum sp. 12E13]RDC74135.1 hypothetical protein DLJ49_05590 [Rhodovulum sp. 12E13]